MAALEAHLADGEQEVQEFDEVDDFAPIDAMEKFGINKGDIKKAKDAGYHTCQGLLMYTRKKLNDTKGLSEAKIEKMLEAARKLAPAVGSWQSASINLACRQRELVRISTGAQAVDELLLGGVESRSITEIYGEHRTGKTQLCMTLCVTTQMPIEMKGGAGKVAYIDTEGTFRAERIHPIAQRFGMDPDAVLGNIIVARAFTHEQQTELLHQVAAMMAEDCYKLLIMDSIMANFRVEFTGRGELADRQQKLGQMLSKLKKIAEEFNVAVVITNHVISDPGAGAMFVADPKKPIGGHVMAHACTTRLSLRKGKGEQRLVKVVDSPCIAESEVSFAISNDGITDYKD